MSEGFIQSAYIISTILFILALGGLSNQETARRGNYYGMVGMAIALIATVFGVVTDNQFFLYVSLIAAGLSIWACWKLWGAPIAIIGGLALAYQIGRAHV